MVSGCAHIFDPVKNERAVYRCRKCGVWCKRCTRQVYGKKWFEYVKQPKTHDPEDEIAAKLIEKVKEGTDVEELDAMPEPVGHLKRLVEAIYAAESSGRLGPFRLNVGAELWMEMLIDVWLEHTRLCRETGTDPLDGEVVEPKRGDPVATLYGVNVYVDECAEPDHFELVAE